MASNKCAFKNYAELSDIPTRWLPSPTNGTDITSWESPSLIIQHQTIELLNNSYHSNCIKGLRN